MEIIKRDPVKFGIAFLVLAAVNVAGWYLFITWKRPLGEPLNLSTSTPVENTIEVSTETPFHTESVTEEPDFTPTPSTPTATFTPEFTPTLEPVCGGPAYMTILVSGVAAEDYLYGLADAIRVVRVDFINQKVAILALPRDMWVDIPVSIPQKTSGVTPGKLNQAYFYGTEGGGDY